MIKPRPYQAQCVRALTAAFLRGATTLLFVMACGLGKTYTSAFFLRWWLKQVGGSVLVLCHQNDILEQLAKRFQAVLGDDITIGFYTGERKDRHRPNILFASLQTMRGHKRSFAKNEFTLVLVDEGHHSTAETFEETICYFTPRVRMAMTATPNRTVIWGQAPIAVLLHGINIGPRTNFADD